MLCGWCQELKNIYLLDRIKIHLYHPGKLTTKIQTKIYLR